MPKKEEELQKKYIQMQIFKQQLEAMMQERAAMEEGYLELNVTLETIKNTKKDDEKKLMWSPIGSGTFAKAKLEDTDKFIISIGRGILVEEPRENAIKLLDTRIKEIEKLQIQLDKQIKHYTNEAQKIEHEMQEMAKET
jgi:prefoldin alpha subunit